MCGLCVIGDYWMGEGGKCVLVTWRPNIYHWLCPLGVVTLDQSLLEPQFPHLGKRYNKLHPSCILGFCETRVIIAMVVAYLDGLKVIAEQKAIWTKYV